MRLRSSPKSTRRAGQLQESIDACRAGLAIHPGYLSARVTLGRALLELGQLDDAQSEFDLVLKSAPENLAAIRGLAEIYHRRGALDDALTQYRAALNLARNDPDLEETVNELTRELAPVKGRPPVDGLSFAQMQQELCGRTRNAPPPVAREPALRSKRQPAVPECAAAGPLPRQGGRSPGPPQAPDRRCASGRVVGTAARCPVLKPRNRRSRPISRRPPILPASRPDAAPWYRGHRWPRRWATAARRARAHHRRRSSSGSTPSMSHAPTDTLSRRHAAIRQVLAARGLDALAVTSLPNIRYLTNFGGSSAIVVLTADRLRFITDFRYLTAIDETRGTASECPGLELVRVDGRTTTRWRPLLAAMPRTRVGFEAAHLTVGRHHWLTASLAGPAPERGCPRSSRQKGSSRARASARTTTRSRRCARRPGACRPWRAACSRRSAPDEPSARSRWPSTGAFARPGFERPAFDTIVASGPNAALPHAPRRAKIDRR